MRPLRISQSSAAAASSWYETCRWLMRHCPGHSYQKHYRNSLHSSVSTWVIESHMIISHRDLISHWSGLGEAAQTDNARIFEAVVKGGNVHYRNSLHSSVSTWVTENHIMVSHRALIST